MIKLHAFVLAATLAICPLAQARAGASPTLIRAAGIPQPSHAGDIVGVVLQNLETSATPPLPLSFGEVFKRGAVKPDESLLLDIGRRVKLQIDPKTYYEDGSVAFAVLTVIAPPLPARTATGAMVIRAPVGTSSPAPLDLAAALRHLGLVVQLRIAAPNGSASRIDIDGVKALEAALAERKARYWRAGPLATEALVSVPVRGSLRLVFDITAFADGTFSADVRFNNDIAMQRTGGTVKYDESITQNGRVVSRHADILQYQYQDWHVVVGTGPSSAQVNIQHDIAYLEQTGAIPYYDLGLGVDASLLGQEMAIMAKPGWDAPLSPNGISQYMPDVGGRPDIGPTTAWNAAWLMTQNPIAARFAVGQADAAGAVPWHFYNAATGRFFTTDDIPNIWAGAPPDDDTSGTTVLTQPISGKTGWVADVAHQPDLSYVAYLLTGREYDLDQLNAQATFSETSSWPTPRNNGRGLVVQHNEVRGAAWGLREIVEAAYANPRGSPMKKYFQKMQRNCFSWMLSQTPAWTESQGEAHGYLPGAYGNPGAMAPWQQDFLASTVVLAAEQGDRQAVRFLKWEMNYLVGRFLSADKGFSPRDGIAYNLNVYDPHTMKTFTTWSAIERATEAAHNSSRHGWITSAQGYYGQLGLQTLAGIITITGSPQARQAYQWLQGSGAPFIDRYSRAGSPQYAIIPGPDPAADGEGR